MQCFQGLIRWIQSGPRAWLSIIIASFLILLLVYMSLVPPSKNAKEYVLPTQTMQIMEEVAEAKSEKVKEEEAAVEQSSSFDSVVTIDPLQHVEVIKAPLPTIDYVIKSGDTLARIFSRLGLSRDSMYSVLEADQEYLVLEPLLPNDKYTFEIDENGNLHSLSRQIDISKRVSFVKHDNGGFIYEEHISPVTYEYIVAHGEIVTNFYKSAKKAGLSDANIAIVYDTLSSRVDFNRDLREHDQFDFVIKKGSINGIQVGETELEALQITVQGQTYRAFIHSDGRYYDVSGNSLTPALRRWPTDKQYRISSAFNANRLHPITGHRAPHNGVDLATPTGTKVLATGDGVVTRVASHRYAGKYVVIDYAGPYGSRFLHLSKILVKKGQQVKRGQVIALSGNTGRSTGAHLHYELHVKGRPVDPMKTKIPTTKSISKYMKKEYDLNVERWSEMMEREE